MTGGHAEDLRVDGLTVFPRAIDPALLERVGTIALERFGGLDGEELERDGLRVGNERYMFPMPIEGPVNDPRLYAPKPVVETMAKLLQPGFIIASATVVTAFPGAAHQNVHRDHSYLFTEDAALSRKIPPYAFTMIVPLVDLETRGGGTRAYVKTHDREPGPVSQLFKRRVLDLELGSVAVMDYRLVHQGMPSTAPIPRPVMFVVFARRWFRDTENFDRHVPLSISPDELSRVPDEHRDLFLLASRPHLV